LTVFVYRDGKVVPKKSKMKRAGGAYVSRFETYDSPIDGASISSHRQRDLDLTRNNAYDVRDVGPNHEFTRAKEARKAENARSDGPRQLDFWR
jgi:hypothetical protein